MQPTNSNILIPELIEAEWNYKKIVMFNPFTILAKGVSCITIKDAIAILIEDLYYPVYPPEEGGAQHFTNLPLSQKLKHEGQSEAYGKPCKSRSYICQRQEDQFLLGTDLEIYPTIVYNGFVWIDSYVFADTKITKEQNYKFAVENIISPITFH